MADAPKPTQPRNDEHIQGGNCGHLRPKLAEPANTLTNFARYWPKPQPNRPRKRRCELDRAHLDQIRAILVDTALNSVNIVQGWTHSRKPGQKFRNMIRVRSNFGEHRPKCQNRVRLAEVDRVRAANLRLANETFHRPKLSCRVSPFEIWPVNILASAVASNELADPSSGKDARVCLQPPPGVVMPAALERPITTR